MWAVHRKQGINKERSCTIPFTSPLLSYPPSPLSPSPSLSLSFSLSLSSYTMNKKSMLIAHHIYTQKCTQNKNNILNDATHQNTISTCLWVLLEVVVYQLHDYSLANLIVFPGTVLEGWYCHTLWLCVHIKCKHFEGGVGSILSKEYGIQ